MSLLAVPQPCLVVAEGPLTAPIATVHLVVERKVVAFDACQESYTGPAQCFLCVQYELYRGMSELLQSPGSFLPQREKRCEKVEAEQLLVRP